MACLSCPLPCLPWAVTYPKWPSPSGAGDDAARVHSAGVQVHCAKAAGKGSRQPNPRPPTGANVLPLPCPCPGVPSFHRFPPLWPQPLAVPFWPQVRPWAHNFLRPPPPARTPDSSPPPSSSASHGSHISTCTPSHTSPYWAPLAPGRSSNLCNGIPDCRNHPEHHSHRP